MNVDSPFHRAREVWLTQFKSIREGDVWSMPGMKEGTGKAARLCRKLSQLQISLLLLLAN